MLDFGRKLLRVSFFEFISGHIRFEINREIHYLVHIITGNYYITVNKTFFPLPAYCTLAASIFVADFDFSEGNIIDC